MANPPPVVLRTDAANRDIKRLRRDLRKLGKEHRQAIDRELKAAAKPIADDAKKRYRVIYPPRRGRGRRSKGSQRGIRSGQLRGQPAVFLGGSRYPYLAGQEWGSNNYPQFPPRRPSKSGRGSAGNFWWPAIEDGGDAARKKIIRAIDRANLKVFPGRLTGRL